MLSPEGERVDLGKGLKARGNVEEWLGKVEKAMFDNLKKKMQDAISDYEINGRQHVIWNFPSQIVLTVSQIFWSGQIHLNLESSNAEKNMKSFEKKCFEVRLFTLIKH